MKYIVATVGSFLLTAGVITNAYHQKKQFYPSVVYITKSSPSMAVLYIQAFVFVVLMGKLIRKVFFGQLRPAEMEHLIERSWYAVTETCLAFTVFRDDFSPRFVALFTLLLFLKCFHWLAEDRVDFMERSPVISLLFHLRATSLLISLALVDTYFINHAYYSTLHKGASVQLVFGFEYAILLTIAMHIFVKYILHTIDLQSENPWENKAVYLLYAEVYLGFIKVVLYCIFLMIMIKVHTFPLFAIRPMYLTVRTFKKALSDVIMSKRAIRNMNNLYPDATPDELAQDDVCIICREPMAQACKKLPCNHIFHASCLRSWFQRQQTCPTCRMDVLRPPAARRPAAAPQPQPAPAPPQAMPGFPAGFPMWPPQQPAAAAQVPPTSSAAGAPPSTPSATPAAPGPMPSMPVPPMAAAPGMSPFMMPPFFMPMPFTVPPPMPGPDLTGLTEDELRQMEGQTRESVEARVQCLRNIQTMLDAAVMQMQQYSTLVQTMANQPTRPVKNDTTVTTSTKTTPSPAENGAYGGARPKTSQPKASTNQTQSITSKSPSSSSLTSAGADAKGTSEEGASGLSLPPEEPIPEWVNERLEIDANTDSDELSEIRRRRVERFSSTNLEDMNESETKDQQSESL